MRAWAVGGCHASTPAAKGWRIPSTAEEDFADSQSADLAVSAERRNGLDFDSFTA